MANLNPMTQQRVNQLTARLRSENVWTTKATKRIHQVMADTVLPLANIRDTEYFIKEGLITDDMLTRGKKL